MVKFVGANYGFLLRLVIGLTGLIVSLHGRRGATSAFGSQPSRPSTPHMEGGGGAVLPSTPLSSAPLPDQTGQGA